MAVIKIREFKRKKECSEREQTYRAYQVVEYAHESCHALYEAFVKLKAGRRGAATDEEQDVLRAMLVSAGAGLDSSLKQLFRDTIQVLIFSNDSVSSSFEKFVVKALGKGNGDLDIDTKLLAKALITPLPIMHLAERYLYELTGSSLQSVDQLFSASSALGLDPKKDVKLDEMKLRPVFDARNKIVHEFDIDFTGARRNRIQRKAEGMVEMANELLLVSQKFVELVFEKLPEEKET